ncbi:MAG: class I SAM-dependent methyltransferase [bacterium]
MIRTNIKGVDLVFKTTQTLFSPDKIDKGTLAMLSKIDFKNEDKVLDLGCGYGVVGILAAKLIGPKNVFMIDNNITAVNLAKENALLNGVGDVTIIQSDGFRNIEEKDFTLIITNPPYHEDFSVPKHFIEKGFNRLKLNGKIYLVTKRKDWYKNKLVNIFGGVQIWEIDDYYVFRSVKRAINYANKKLIKRRNKTIPKS